MPFDPTRLLSDISEAEPAGENLEFDIEFGALDRIAAGKPEQQYGGTVVPAEQPDWKEVDAAALALLARTRDLRVLVHLAIAELNLSGIAAFVGVLDVTRQLLDTKWPHLHPQLDPDDDNDPTLRANALLRLSDPGKVLRPLRDAVVATSPRSGPITWRDLAMAAGALEPPPGKEKPAEAVMRGGFADTDPGKLAAMRDALALGQAAAAGISAAFDTNAGYGTGPDLSELTKLLREIQRYIERWAPQGAQAEADIPEPEEAVAAADTPSGPSAPRAGGVSAASLTSISTRAEAMKLMDLVLDYYRRFEPSSPLPLLLERARRLADKNFIDILRDLAPDAVNQAQIVTGARDE
jgi:type VI secretion system protein ImpA